MKTTYACGCETSKKGHGRLCEEHGAPMVDREYTKEELKAHKDFEKAEAARAKAKAERLSGSAGSSSD